MMHLIEKTRFLAQGDRTDGIFPGAVTYVDDARAMAVRYGCQSASDTYDGWTDLISVDNGQTWSPPVLRNAGIDCPEGYILYSENTAFYDAQTGHTVYLHDRGLRRPGMEIKEIEWDLAFLQYTHATGEYREREHLNFGFPRGVMISFSRPVLTTAGRLLIPAQTPVLDADGNMVRHPNGWTRALHALMIIGERQGDWWQWRPGGLASISLDASSRGIFEPAVAELEDGRLVMVCRGDNSAFPERPGFKWVCYSDDGGETWGNPTPLRYSDGGLLESGSNGSALFRSWKTGKLYWIGNPCLAGVQAHGNNPRTPLAIFEVDDQPFALRRESMLIIDQRAAKDASRVQFSNFRLLEDRETGDALLFMTRIGEKTDEDFRKADLYRYRIALEG